MTKSSVGISRKLEFSGLRHVHRRMNPEGKTVALLATARIANVPSVVSNLGTGVLLGWIGTGGVWDWPWLLMVAVVLFYIAGNFLNDWMDREWDRENRPERALPRGLFSSNSYLVVAVLGAVAGLGMAALYGLLAFCVSLLLVFLIVLYTVVHKRVSWSVVPMGLCRASLPVIGFVSVVGELSLEIVFPSVALLVYIIALSLSARWEARKNLPEREWLVARGLLVMSGLIAAGILFMLDEPVAGVLGLIPFFIWLTACMTKFQSPVPVHVSALLAGIPWVDFITYVPIAAILLNMGTVNFPDGPVLVALVLAPVSFVAGRLLQRVASAT